MSRKAALSLSLLLTLVTNAAGAASNNPEDPCLAFTCMGGKWQGREATSGTDCVTGRQSFFNKRVYTPYGYDPNATAELRRGFLQGCGLTTKNASLFETIIQRYGRSFQE